MSSLSHFCAFVQTNSSISSLSPSNQQYFLENAQVHILGPHSFLSLETPDPPPPRELGLSLETAEPDQTPGHRSNKIGLELEQTCRQKKSMFVVLGLIWHLVQALRLAFKWVKDRLLSVTILAAGTDGVEGLCHCGVQQCPDPVSP